MPHGQPSSDTALEARPEVPASILRAARPTTATRRGRAAVPAKWVALSHARRRRRRLRGTVVCVTGSVGKTTTKHVLNEVLRDAGAVATHRLGSNRAMSVIRTLRAAAGADYVVQEIGATGPESLDELLWALEPDVAIVTAVASDHFGAFRSLDNVEREKAKAVTALSEDGIAILNADDERVLRMAALCRGRVVTFGAAPDADVRITDVRGGYPDGVGFRAHTSAGAFDVATRLHGPHQAGAAAAALACALALGHPPGRAIASIARVDPAPHRLSALRAPGAPTFLLDDRKASIATVAPALATLDAARHPGRKVVVVGQISDTYVEKRRLYRDVTRDALAVADHVVLVGRWAHHGPRAVRDGRDGSVAAFASVREAGEYLRRELRPDDLALVKGSRDFDHLARVALQFSRDVRCWTDACRRRTNCEGCELLERRPARRRLGLPGRRHGS